MAKSVKKTNLWDGLEPEEKDVSTHTDVDTHTHKHNHGQDEEPAKVKTTKNKRIQILTYSNLVRRMDSYAKRNALSRAEVFELAVTEFLDRNS